MNGHVVLYGHDPQRMNPTNTDTLRFVLVPPAGQTFSLFSQRYKHLIDELVKEKKVQTLMIP